jgi:hypothetical protein
VTKNIQHFTDGREIVRTRVPSSADEHLIRAARLRDARGNLAAMACTRHGIDPTAVDPSDPRVVEAAAFFAEVADALGIREVTL